MGLFPKKNSKVPPDSISLITLTDQASPIVEQYRTIRTNIQFMLADQSLKSIVVTSAGLSEGKSTTVANLAVVFANTGMRTLLVDADLRRPTVARTFALDNTEGFSDLLSNSDLALQSVAQLASINNLTILTSGQLPSNPAELIGSQRMDQLLAQMNQEYDVVLFDVPPVMAVTDAQILAAKADAVLIVVRENVTKKEELIEARKMLQFVKANIIGTVYNGRTEVRSQSYYS